MLQVLKAEIEKELEDIRTELERIRLKKRKLRIENDSVLVDALYDSIASAIHSIYGGIEKVLVKIIKEIDRNVPVGKNWHRELLQRVSIEIPHIRPRIISDISREYLENILSFRHAFRNLYLYRLLPEKVIEISRISDRAFKIFEKEVKHFLKTVKKKH